MGGWPLGVARSAKPISVKKDTLVFDDGLNRKVSRHSGSETIDGLIWAIVDIRN